MFLSKAGLMYLFGYLFGGEASQVKHRVKQLRSHLYPRDNHLDIFHYKAPLISRAIRKCGSSECGRNLDSSVVYKTADLRSLPIRKVE